MKKIVLFGLCATMAVSNANASWFGDLFKKQSEPQTLAEACNTDEITSICPEIALGQKTLTECLTENVKSLSKKCSKYVKKSIKENKELVLGTADSASDAVDGQVADVKSAVADKKAAVADAKTSLKNKKTEIKANAKAAGKELKEAATAVKNDAVETGKSFKEIAK